MKIGIDINPTIEKSVGKGTILKNILEELSEIDNKNEYILFGISSPNLNLRDNFILQEIPGKEKFSWDLRCFRKAVLKYKVNVFLSVKSLYAAILHPKSVLSIDDLGIIRLPKAYSNEVIKKYKRLLPIALKRAKTIVTPSLATKSHILNTYNINKKKINKIAYAASNWTKTRTSDEDLLRVKERYGLSDNFFVFTGTLEARKNLIKLIDAFSEFNKNDQNNYKLFIIGKNGYKYEEITKRVIDKKMSHKIIFTGYISEVDLKPIYQQARAFVFPSLLEGFGISVLEAMACGLPVISSKKGAIGEVVSDACLEIDPQDVFSIVKSLQRISIDNELSESLSKKGFDRIKKYSWEKTAKQYLNVLEEVGNN